MEAGIDPAPGRSATTWAGSLHSQAAALLACDFLETSSGAGIDPVSGRSSAMWAGFLRSRAEVLPACDFFETVTLSGARLHVLAAIEHASRRIRILGATGRTRVSRMPARFSKLSPYRSRLLTAAARAGQGLSRRFGAPAAAALGARAPYEGCQSHFPNSPRPCASTPGSRFRQLSAAAVHETGGNSMVSTPSARAALALAAGLTRSRSASVFFA